MAQSGFKSLPWFFAILGIMPIEFEIKQSRQADDGQNETETYSDHSQDPNPLKARIMSQGQRAKTDHGGQGGQSDPFTRH